MSGTNPSMAYTRQIIRKRSVDRLFLRHISLMLASPNPSFMLSRSMIDSSELLVIISDIFVFAENVGVLVLLSIVVFCLLRKDNKLMNNG